MRPDDVRALALLLPEVVEAAHQGHPDFRLCGRIFATLWVEEERVVLKLTPADQARVVADAPDLFAPVPGAWGRRGWTNLDLWDVDETVLREALLAAWRTVAPAALDGG
ncbi:MmcQ/YjbR family DNA-binding protein [Methylobacterium sp. J-090]|uniref:MmcQ/YjbR family DNA-binding protein n=1 Tax=Methylobacterium sp. J-090 TaxID=2836666 RepID=UPI001FBC07F9|nr:MmcQ/YjbR family DNA-binding protein [Methylobacterium sp. J-090]MCJ2083118.1 MmcQ/YjbR family DNA-binding protein [Methylobacterium sp. J-090]